MCSMECKQAVNVFFSSGCGAEGTHCLPGMYVMLQEMEGVMVERLQRFRSHCSGHLQTVDPFKAGDLCCGEEFQCLHRYAVIVRSIRPVVTLAAEQRAVAR